MESGYQEARARAAFDARVDRGRVRLAGADAKPFLHALVTNDVASLLPGETRYAALLTPQGRMITDMTVVAGEAGGADVLHLVVPSDAAAPLAARLDQSIFTEAVEVADVSAATAHFSVTGPEAGDVAARATAAAGAAGDAITWPSDELGLAGVDVIVAAPLGGAVGEALAGLAAALSPAAREILRVEAGRPEFGADMTAETIPLEAGLLDRAISTTKGCYVGQEVIIRVLHRGGGRVAKRLVRLRFDAPEPDVPAAGTVLAAAGKDVGRVTSAVWSPRSQAVIGLGYVHRDVAIEGQALTAGGRAAVITLV